MKGLILKDFYTSIKELRLYFVIMALFILASFVSEDMYFMAIYPCLICGMFPQSLMAFDERSKWENYCGTFPIKNKDIVLSENDRLKAAVDLVDGIMEEEEKSIIIVFYGKNVNDDEVNVLQNHLESEYPLANIGFIDGKQDVYDYIISLE